MSDGCALVSETALQLLAGHDFVQVHRIRTQHVFATLLVALQALSLSAHMHLQSITSYPCGSGGPQLQCVNASGTGAVHSRHTYMQHEAVVDYSELGGLASVEELNSKGTSHHASRGIHCSLNWLMPPAVSPHGCLHSKPGSDRQKQALSEGRHPVVRVCTVAICRAMPSTNNPGLGAAIM